MRYRFLVFATAWLFATLAMAQTSTLASSGQSDSLASRPAAASSTSYRSHAPTVTAADRVHFKFKDRQQDQQGPLSQPPPSAMDKAAVMGTDRPWQDGRPPVDCMQTPMDPTCRH